MSGRGDVTPADRPTTYALPSADAPPLGSHDVDWAAVAARQRIDVVGPRSAVRVYWDATRHAWVPWIDPTPRE